MRISLFVSTLLFALHINASAASNETCCGPVSAKGAQLAEQLQNSGVERLWLAGKHVDWESGEPDQGDKPAKSHCSAFAAAFAKKLDVYLLRPPQHSQVLLASAQVLWLQTEAARATGWRPVADGRSAQTLANQGQLVVAGFQSPDPRKPGHIAIVRPAELIEQSLKEDGPRLTQAGQKNYLSTNARIAFRYHPGAWPDGIRYFVFDGKSAP